MSIFILALAFLYDVHALWLQERAAPSVISFPLVRGEIAANSLYQRDNAVSIHAKNNVRFT
jgi:hypothetical protein